MLSNFSAGESSWVSLGLQGAQTSVSNTKSTLTGRVDTEAETPILWPPDVKSWFIGKDSDAGKDWRQEEKGTREDEMVGWHHGLNGPESEQTPGVGNGQRSLACYSPWGHKESDMTEWLNWTEAEKCDWRQGGCWAKEWQPWSATGSAPSPPCRPSRAIDLLWNSSVWTTGCAMRKLCQL